MKRPSSTASRPQAVSNFTKALGLRLRVEREAQGITLNDLAQAAGCSINTIRWHEAGSRMLRADELAAVARHLRLDPQGMMLPHHADREADAMLRKVLGRRMQATRAMKGKRQLDVAARAGVTISDLQDHESGAKSLRVDALARVAGVLEVEPQDLMSVGDALA